MSQELKSFPRFLSWEWPTNAPSQSDSGPLIILFVIFIFLFLPIVCYKLVKREREQPKDSKDLSPKVDELNHVKVLVICPYCGSKTEQGITKCQKCGAEL